MCPKYTLDFVAFFLQIAGIFLMLRLNKYTLWYLLCNKQYRLYLFKLMVMKTYLLACALLMASVQLLAQKESTKELFAFTITDYIVPANDSIIVVQVQMPAGSGVVIEKEQMGVLRHNFSNNNNDTGAIGWGRCRIIKGDYYYFGLHLNNTAKKPQKNDVLYTYAVYPAPYKGRLYGLIKNAIYFEHVTEGIFFDFYTPQKLNAEGENSWIDSLVEDIKFTGREMLKQNSGQNQDITTGIFTGKKLFTAMQAITSDNVKDFLDYVIARPQKYAGNTWKIAETFATWMTNGTPTVKRN